MNRGETKAFVTGSARRLDAWPEWTLSPAAEMNWDE
jgi:hypothetical protein